MTFSPSSSSSSLVAPHMKHHHHLSYHMMPGGTESGYGSGFSLSRPLDSFDASSSSLVTSQDNAAGGGGGSAQTTPRTTAAINYMSALQLSTPRMGMRSSQRKGTPLKRHQTIFSHSNVYETTPKKCKSHENNENHEMSYVTRSGSMKMAFRSRLDRSLSQPMSPLAGNGGPGGGGGAEKLDCTFDAISSSTPICQPFRAEFYEQQVEEIPLKNLPRSGGKNVRTKLIRKMQSFSPRKLMGLRGAKVPLREMDQNSVDFYTSGLFPVEEEAAASPIPKASGGVKKVLFSDTVTTVGGGGAFSSGLRDLMFGKIKTNLKEEGEEEKSFSQLETTNILSGSNTRKPSKDTSSQLLDIYVTNLSNLDGGDSNSHSAVAEDGDVSMNTSMVAEVERYFDELKRNTTQLQEGQAEDKGKYVPLMAKDSLDLQDMLLKEEEEPKDTPVEKEEERPMEVEQGPVEQGPPMLLRKRKRPSTELIQAVLATPKKMRRSQSFHMGDGGGVGMFDENMEETGHRTDASGDHSHHLLSPLSQQRIGGARKRLNYEPVPRNRCSPAKRALAFEGRRSLVGTNRLNIFRHLGNCPPVRDYFFDFVDDKDLVAIYAVNRQCRRMIEEHPRLNGRRLKYLEAAWRKKENCEEVYFSSSSLSSGTLTLSPPEDLPSESHLRIPLHNRNVDTSSLSVNETMSPPVSPSRRKFHENQKLVQRNPGAFFVSCPRCRSASVIERVDEVKKMSQSHHMQERGQEENSNVNSSFRSLRSQSMCVSELRSRNTSLMIPVRKQFSLPDNSSCSGTVGKEDQRMGTCQSIQCGFRFCVHCSYAFEPGHQCIEIGTLSPLIKQSRQPRVVACSKQSKRNLKRL